VPTFFEVAREASAAEGGLDGQAFSGRRLEVHILRILEILTDFRLPVEIRVIAVLCGGGQVLKPVKVAVFARGRPIGRSTGLKSLYIFVHERCGLAIG
jgi:hypothetical protein